MLSIYKQQSVFYSEDMSVLSRQIVTFSLKIYCVTKNTDNKHTQVALLSVHILLLEIRKHIHRYGRQYSNELENQI